VKEDLESVQKIVNAQVAEVRQKREEFVEKFNGKVLKIKDVCSNYFERYDKDLEDVQTSMAILNQKYEEWSKVLIEPSSLNDARLFALETRLHEEEDVRVKEYEYLRDLMKKLVFSLE